MSDDPSGLPSQLRFHLDEHLSPTIARVLTGRGIDTSSTQSAGLLRAADESQFQFAQRTGRVFVTRDADFLVMSAQLSSHCGIIFLAAGQRSIGAVIGILEIVAGCLTTDDVRDRVHFM